jgi:hemerythrin-like domain-containing protein
LLQPVATSANPERKTMAKTRSRASGPIEMLKEDHDKVKKAFKEFEKLDREDTETCRQLVETVCADLKVHTTLEEELFYPAVREAIEDEDIMNEASIEHETAKMLIEQLENMGPDDPNYRATFTVLGEYVMHHVKEEEGEMFPQAKKADLDLEGLGERMRARKEELIGQTQAENA